MNINYNKKIFENRIKGVLDVDDVELLGLIEADSMLVFDIKKDNEKYKMLYKIIKKELFFTGDNFDFRRLTLFQLLNIKVIEKHTDKIDKVLPILNLQYEDFLQFL